MKKIYTKYFIGLILCIAFGIGLTIIMLFAVDSSSIVLTFLGGIVSVFAFVFAAFLSFFFVKNLILMKGKKAIIPILIWNAAVVVLSMASLSVWFGGFSWDYLLLTAILYIIPCVASSIVSALIYSKTSNIQGQMERMPNTVRDIVSQVSLFFIPTVLLLLYGIATTPAVNGSIMMIFSGVQSPITLTVVLASCAYAIGVSKRTTKKFPLTELAVNVILSVISSFGIYFYAILIDKEGFSLLKSEHGIMLVIIMTLLPPLAFAITSLITLAVRRGKKAEDSSAA